MKKLLIIISFISPFLARGQCGNLFRNASFEENAILVGPHKPNDLGQAHKSKYWADDQTDVPWFGCTFGSNCMIQYHSPDWFDNDAVTLLYHTLPGDPIECGGYLPAPDGSLFIGMGSGELLEQNFEAGSDLQSGQQYIISMNIHLFRDEVIAGGGTIDGSSMPLVWDVPNPHLKVMIGKNKIKYEDPHSFHIDKHFGPFQSIVEVMDVEFNTETEEYCNWQTIVGSFTAPSSANTYDWIAIEVQVTQPRQYYVAIDQVNLVRGCLMTCSRTDNVVANIHSTGTEINNSTAFHIVGIENVTDATLEVRNIAGALVYTHDFHCTNGLENGIYWYGKNTAGSNVANGFYSASIIPKNDCGTLCPTSPITINKINNYLGPIFTEDCYQGTIKTPEECCSVQPDIYIDGLDLDGPGLLRYHAANNIFSGTLSAVNYLPNSEVELKAANEIVIGPNNHIEVGADFHAFIAPCTKSTSSTREIVDFQPREIKGIQTLEPSNSTAVIYPNPSKGMFNISIDGDGENNSYFFEIIDAQGKMVYTENFTYTGGSKAVNLNADNGVYFLLLKDGNQKIIKRDRIVVAK